MSRSRLCDGPGACNPTMPLQKTIACDMGSCPPGGETCAIVYDNNSATKDEGPSITMGEGEIKDLKTFKRGSDGDNWYKAISYVEVMPHCSLKGYKRSKFISLLGTWTAGEDVLKHDLLKNHENNKAKSLKCSCTPQTCEGKYVAGLGKPMPDTCSMPSCSSVAVDTCDAWRKMVSLLCLKIFF